METNAVILIAMKKEQRTNHKRARYLSSLESSLVDEEGSNRKPVGLPDLFGHRKIRRRHGDDIVSNFALQPPRRNQDHFLNEQDKGFFTLRLEHRQEVAVPQHIGEERICMFRSDRPGAIAKIIYSSTPAVAASPVPSNDDPMEDEETEFKSMVQAKIHMLDVKEPYRGYDLGGLLFSEAIHSLCQRYMHDDSNDDDINRSSVSSSIRCQLDAEEDTRRHNRLVNFYKDLGCSVKPRAKIQYITNNDSETYRKIPMQMAVRNNNKDRRRNKLLDSSNGSLADISCCFLPIQLLDSTGASIHVPQKDGRGLRSHLEWLMVEDGEGHVQFRTTHGLVLRADPDGFCSADMTADGDNDGFCSMDMMADDDNDGDPDKSLDWANFRLYRATEDPPQQAYLDDDVCQKELWTLKTAHGSFLAGRHDSQQHSVHCSKFPVFWQADDDTFSLILTSDTPPRRRHYRKSWEKQTMEYIRKMHQRYLGFQLKTMSIRTALNLVKETPFLHFQVARSSADPGPSLRTLCFKLAEASRLAGHPDWVQLAALVHELGAVVNLIDITTAAGSEDDYDWTLPCRSRVVGAAAPARTKFSEFKSLNADERDSRYNTSIGMYSPHCGLDNVLLAWTGPEYMYHLLQHNNDCRVPEEGLAMLRYFSLEDWHAHSEYRELTNEHDVEMQAFVSEFDQMRREERSKCINLQDLTDEECDRLWQDHYGSIVAKYCGTNDLKW